jgi:hypothetical protein
MDVSSSAEWRCLSPNVASVDSDRVVTAHAHFQATATIKVTAAHRLVTKDVFVLP